VSAWGEVEEFGAYNADRFFNILGLPQQNFFAQAETGQGLIGQLTGEQDVGGTPGDPSVFADIVAGENAQLADPGLPWLSVPPIPNVLPDGLDVPAWVWWTLGITAAVVVLSQINPLVKLIDDLAKK
jgi:hypothetical protein